MNLRFERCNNPCSNPKIAIIDPNSKSKCKLIISNQNKKIINIIHIDGCVITSGKRCDFLVLHGNKARVFEEIYIELKGGDIQEAIEQLEKTIIQVSIEKTTFRKCCFIICTHCPMITGELQVAKRKFKEKYNSTLLVRENSFEYAII